MQILTYLLLGAFVISCTPQGEGYKLSSRDPSNLNPIEGDDDHDKGEGEGNPTLNTVNISSDMSVKTEIYDRKIIPVSISASNSFKGGNVSLSVNRSVIDSEAIDAGQYIKFTFSESSFALGVGETKEVTLTVDVTSMAPSFKGKLNGGMGEFKIVVSSGGESSTFGVSFEVDPVITVKFTNPLTYAIGPDTIATNTQVNVRPHAAPGIELKTLYANKFPQAYIDTYNGDPGPCMHIDGGNGLRHCDQGADFENVGDSYSHGRVLPGINKTTQFYDHNDQSDRSRSIRFNQTP